MASTTRSQKFFDRDSPDSHKGYADSPKGATSKFRKMSKVLVNAGNAQTHALMEGSAALMGAGGSGSGSQLSSSI